MKKNKVIILIIFLLCFPLCFFACDNDKQIRLSTPCTIGYVLNDTANPESPQLLLVTDKNPNASKYEFCISDSENEEKNYISYFVNENYIDVTNIFTDQKEYSFYVRYIGNKKYTNSKPSQIKTYNASSLQVTTPSLQINDTTLNWFKISYATGYEIYETVKNADNSIKTAATKIATLNNSTYSFDISSRISNSDAPYYKFYYSVKALGTGFYSNSNNSNDVEFIKHVKLNTPENLVVSKNNENKFILSFNEVDYATKYKVIVNDSNEASFETTETSCDVTNYITNYASFYFKVQALNSGIIDYEKSVVSNNIEYKNQLKLSVSNLTCSRDGENIVIAFDGHELASNKYTLIIKQGEVEYKDALFTLDSNGTRKLLISSDLGMESGTITISVKANAVSNYILESDYISINYEIL